MRAQNAGVLAYTRTGGRVERVPDVSNAERSERHAGASMKERRNPSGVVDLASLSTTSLNRFVEFAAKAEALSVELSFIINDIRNPSSAAISGQGGAFRAGDITSKPNKDQQCMPLSVFKPR